MGRIPRDIVDAIRDRTDIAGVVSRHVKLQKRGNSLVGLCPFHQEKTPSFHVIPSKAMYHCFGCQAGGDVFRFLMTIEGLSFVESVKELAGPAGVVIEERELSMDERRALRARSTLFDVLEEAASYYESVLWTHPDGEIARDYLKKRRLDSEVSRAARLGFAADGWSRLLDHLHRKGFSAERVLEAGLARKRNSGDGHYDAFRGRLMFPIQDERGRVIGFGGRILEGDAPKYINTPETKLYDKSRVLYGLNTARSAIQRCDCAIIVEGYFDVLAMQQAGHPEAVATCGTALTPDHVTRIKRMTGNVILLTDGDSAGQKAAAKALPQLVKAGLHGFRVELPGAKDPDEFVREFGTVALDQALNQRQSLVEWVIEQKMIEYSDKTSMGTISTSMAREQILSELRPLLAHLPQRQLPRIAGLLRIPDVEVVRAAQQAPQPDHSPPPPAATSGWRPDRTIVHIFWLLIHRYDQVADLLQRVPPSIFSAHPQVQPSMSRLLTGEPPAAVINDEPDEGVRRTLLAVVAREDLYDPEIAARGLCDMVAHLIRPRLAAARTQQQLRLQAAERAGDIRDVLIQIRDHKTLELAFESALQSGDPHVFLAEVDRGLQSLAPVDERPEPGER